mgnify:CR=1 FL=1
MVIQVIVAEEEVREFAKTDEITGAVLSTPIMVRVKVVVFAAPPVAVPVTVIVYVPAGVEAPAEIVSVVEQLGLQEVGEKIAAAPVGSPEAEKETD